MVNALVKVEANKIADRDKKALFIALCISKLDEMIAATEESNFNLSKQDKEFLLEYFTGCKADLTEALNIIKPVHERIHSPAPNQISK